MTRNASCFILALLCSAAFAHPLRAQATGPRSATVLLIRHAEKPEEGDGLTPAGEARARAYVGYFGHLRQDSASLEPDEIFAAADSRHSRRPRLTVQPLAQALRLPVDTGFKDEDFASLARALRTGHDGKKILVCWHHGVLPEFLRSLGADPGTLLPGGRWPGDEYDWLIILRYDADGHLADARRLDEHLTAPR